MFIRAEPDWVRTEQKRERERESGRERERGERGRPHRSKVKVVYENLQQKEEKGRWLLVGRKIEVCFSASEVIIDRSWSLQQVLLLQLLLLASPLCFSHGYFEGRIL